MPAQLSESSPARNIKAPHYLTAHYWWAYVHPRAVRFFERQWLVNLILWGNYARLRNAALAELGDELPGTTLQVACVYGDLTGGWRAGRGRRRQARRRRRAADAAGKPRDKLPAGAPARLLAIDTADLSLPDASYDRVLVFFPAARAARRASRAHPEGVFASSSPAARWSSSTTRCPIGGIRYRYVWRSLLAVLEPFALDLWRHQIADWLPAAARSGWRKQSFFGGLYQKVVIKR